ncbi:hypothetical protein [Psychroserpens luteolus]|uniref:hypothetical protein n=1 Tax=Psychroserpens luteolus TaxID=2855840 RepID=UPI001E4FFDED|nr:hypothetical protein [Psychroserpens luteolus]MCD2259743.1 hypothetical protein [Psychroserpens luteolus]
MFAGKEMEATADIELEVAPESLLRISTQKLNEYVELIKLKQEHPEFESEINAQLLSFTSDSLTLSNYPRAFTISDIHQIGGTRIEGDSLELFTLGFTVHTNTVTFKDSVLTRVSSRSDYTQYAEAVIIKKVTFLKFNSN